MKPDLQDRDKPTFGFMSNDVSSERRVEVAVARVAQMLRDGVLRYHLYRAGLTVVAFQERNCPFQETFSQPSDLPVNLSNITGPDRPRIARGSASGSPADPAMAGSRREVAGGE